MSYKLVKQYFEKVGLGDRVKVREITDTVENAAKAVGCEPKRIAKTISFIVDDDPILIVCAGDAKVDNKKYKDMFLKKAKMIPIDRLDELVGHEIGGVCPFAINDGVKVYLDESLKRFDTVHAAAGSSNSTIELSIEELEKYSNFKNWIDVCKGWE